MGMNAFSDIVYAEGELPEFLVYGSQMGVGGLVLVKFEVAE
jgi:hypothetical protein